MRILLAHDGSDGAETALRLVASLPRPTPSTVHAVRVIEPLYDLFGMPTVDVGRADTTFGAGETALANLEAQLGDLAADDLTVESNVVIGRPASVIVKVAASTGADVIAMGSRGRGPMASMLLGSVSAEVVEHAPCPVIVARRATMDHVIVAVDGSEMTDLVVDAVIRLGCFTGRRLEVVAVAPSPVPGPAVMLAGGYGMSMTWFEDGMRAAREALTTAATGAAARFTDAGLDASWCVPEGDVSATLVDHVRTSGADAIVLGTRGRTGLDRLLLGSVARNVLHHADATVVVVPRS